MTDKIRPEVSVIIPTYCEENVIAEVIARVQRVMKPTCRSFEIIVVDDGSPDQTALKAKETGVVVIQHPYNIGNGASVKTGIRNAKGQVLVMLDGDGQHPPETIPALLEKLGPYDMVIAARTRESITERHRDLANKIYNVLATYVTGRKIEDLTSGFRAMKSSVAHAFVYLLPNTFSYPTTITLATIRSGRSVTFVPVTTEKRVGKSKVKLLEDGIRFLLIIMKIAVFFAPLKVFLPVSIFLFMLGFGYAIFKVFVLDLSYGPTATFLMTISIVVFLIGLVSEQITQLRFDRSEQFEN